MEEEIEFEGLGAWLKPRTEKTEEKTLQFTKESAEKVLKDMIKSFNDVGLFVVPYDSEVCSHCGQALPGGDDE